MTLLLNLSVFVAKQKLYCQSPNTGCEKLERSEAGREMGLLRVYQATINVLVAVPLPASTVSLCVVTGRG